MVIGGMIVGFFESSIDIIGYELGVFNIKIIIKVVFELKKIVNVSGE